MSLYIIFRWAVVLALGGAVYVYYKSKPSTGRSRGRSLTRTNKTSAAGTDSHPKHTDNHPKGAWKPNPKAKAPRKTAKKVVQETKKKVEPYIPEAASDDKTQASPESSITSKIPSGKDVSDMLDPKGFAPTVMRIIPSDKPARPSKPQQLRAEPVHETKKQRQNKKKAEEAKEARQQAEKERQMLLENQRRTAREARGEPAKNGLQSSKAPTTNAWASGRPASTESPALLDTFEPQTAAPVPNRVADAVNGTASNGQGLANGLSEEEQLRLVLEDSAWETVPKGKKGKKTKGVEDADEVQPLVEAPKKAAPAKQAPAPKVEAKAQLPRFSAIEELPDVGHPLDSEWKVL
ncbi:hypothetical protein M011DRAFT_494467 [Sporormia fimetaria CBS 119925]|uniref:Uncharacterized protein n=1 Tax=Sporormia fimetaria CBS 119925 TaxID=1340428 RepID=A0A6A6VDV7_9PLEO|nr:hypothetical protein M011DRAFT_494467 [Sporormia fimetaria CBS 119925]